MLDYKSILDMAVEGQWDSILKLIKNGRKDEFPSLSPPAELPYSRQILYKSEMGEVLLMSWNPGKACQPHDHGNSQGAVFFLNGEFKEESWNFENRTLKPYSQQNHKAGGFSLIKANIIHSMEAGEGGLSFHIYFPQIENMKVYDTKDKRTLEVSNDCGAWIPTDEKQILSTVDWQQKPVIWISYTTEYREGGVKFKQVADTMAKKLVLDFPDHQVVCDCTESKHSWQQHVKRFSENGQQISHLHFIGHSGLYGIMFGSTKWPEQFSPYEWENMKIPFSRGAQAYFHACRTARWFAPFFAQVFQVEAYGYFWYTTVSLQKDCFKWEGKTKKEAPLYIVSCVGRKSHELWGSIQKYSGLAKPFEMVKFTPDDFSKDRTYDKVAELYDKVFMDIRVRKDEWRWLAKQFPGNKTLKVLDIGCGNGALLKQLSERICSGVGVDLSKEMIKNAEQRCAGISNLSFKQIDSPQLPFEDNSFDIVISFMSFRYLDWDPIMKEIKRVLTPQGRLLIVDMVAGPAKFREMPSYINSKVKNSFQKWKNKEYQQNLRNLVTHPEWKNMVKYNPMRAEHEYRMYLESRFPKMKLETLNIGMDHRIVAFNSGEFGHAEIHETSYP